MYFSFIFNEQYLFAYIQSSICKYVFKCILNTIFLITIFAQSYYIVYKKTVFSYCFQAAL